MSRATQNEIRAHADECGEKLEGCHWDDCPLAVCEAGCCGEGCQSCGWTGHRLNDAGRPIWAPEYDEPDPDVIVTGQLMTTRVFEGGTAAKRIRFAEALAAAAMSDARAYWRDREPDMVPHISSGGGGLTFLTRDGADTEDFPIEAPAYCAVLKMAEAFGVVVED